MFFVAVIKQKSDSLKKDGNLKDVQNNIEGTNNNLSKVYSTGNVFMYRKSLIDSCNLR